MTTNITGITAMTESLPLAASSTAPPLLDPVTLGKGGAELGDYPGQFRNHGCWLDTRCHFSLDNDDRLPLASPDNRFLDAIFGDGDLPQGNRLTHSGSDLEP